MHGLIMACISDTHAFKVAIPFKGIYSGLLEAIIMLHNIT